MYTNPFQTCSLIHVSTVHPFGYETSVIFLQISRQSTLFLFMLSQLFPICLHTITLALLSTKNRKYTITYMCIHICTRHGPCIKQMWVVLKVDMSNTNWKLLIYTWNWYRLLRSYVVLFEGQISIFRLQALENAFWSTCPMGIFLHCWRIYLYRTHTCEKYIICCGYSHQLNPCKHTTVPPLRYDRYRIDILSAIGIHCNHC